MTPKAYTLKSPSGPLPLDSCPTKKKHMNTQTLPMNYAMCITTQLFSKSQYQFNKINKKTSTTNNF